MLLIAISHIFIFVWFGLETYTVVGGINHACYWLELFILLVLLQWYDCDWIHHPFIMFGMITIHLRLCILIIVWLHWNDLNFTFYTGLSIWVLVQRVTFCFLVHQSSFMSELDIQIPNAFGMKVSQWNSFLLGVTLSSSF